MKTNKILLGGLAGGVTFFILGWLVYGVLLMDYVRDNQNQCVMRLNDDMVWWALILSNLAIGFLFSIVFGWSNTKGVLSGAKVGAILGLLITIAGDAGIYAMSTSFNNFTAVIIDIVVYTVMCTIVGAVIALVMSLGKNEV